MEDNGDHVSGCSGSCTSYEAYTATTRGDPAPGVVTGAQTEDGVTATNVEDALPLAGGHQRDAGLQENLGAVTDPYAGSDLLASNGTAIPESVLRTHGFHYDGWASVELDAR